MNVSTSAERKILGVLYSDPMVMVACAYHVNRLGGYMVAVKDDENEDGEALIAFDLYADAILVDDEKFVRPCRKPLLVTTSPTRESIRRLLYN